MIFGSDGDSLGQPRVLNRVLSSAHSPSTRRAPSSQPQLVRIKMGRFGSPHTAYGHPSESETEPIVHCDFDPAALTQRFDIVLDTRRHAAGQRGPEDVDAQRSHHQHQAQPSEHGEKRHTWPVPRRDRSTSDRRHRSGRASRGRRSSPVTDRPSGAIIGSNPSAHGTGTKRQREAGQAHHSARVSPPDRRRCPSPRCFASATDGGHRCALGVQLRCGRDSFATTRVPNATN
jgi:hypothetical protein